MCVSSAAVRAILLIVVENDMTPLVILGMSPISYVLAILRVEFCEEFTTLINDIAGSRPSAVTTSGVHIRFL